MDGKCACLVKIRKGSLSLLRWSSGEETIEAARGRASLKWVAISEVYGRADAEFDRPKSVYIQILRENAKISVELKERGDAVSKKVKKFNRNTCSMDVN